MFCRIASHRGVLAGSSAAIASTNISAPHSSSGHQWRPSAPDAARCDDDALRTASQALLRPMIHYAELHGLLYADKNTSQLGNAVPCRYAPVKIPAQAFDDAVALSQLWNKLVDAVARDVTWLHATLEATTRGDPFTKRLVEMSKALHARKLRQELMLGIHRSDYMQHDPEGSSERPKLLQVELNTIASSMASHSANVFALHRYMLDRYGRGSDSVARALSEHYGAGGSELVGRLPQNETLKHIPDALAAAHREIGGGVEVSVAYFRAGYGPDDYPTEAEWEARELLEQSLAIKCPSVDYQLVGTKKVQQALARPGGVERFVGATDGAALRTCFAGLWGLGPGEDDAVIIEHACRDPQGYVLKPQREGGGNNFYGQDVAKKLHRELSPEERAAYILMQRILPQKQTSVMTRAGKAEVQPGLSEFGFYSVFLGNGKDVLLSEHAGHLVRTKAEGVDEGGVAA
eukprot:CAMPEP_0175315674 /NCGR_PEP_ID=MMETSP0093-20121207/69018_1 /TAXON_ID=311494 /ORGANISM="Alexandrium monilatum, Strain CCMP3105" /LENGTH=460 /DNA_ID=CAMNT_0016612413 /DNA_START=1 /DNA_END=1381 /DNA_ORIENTATION=+